MTKHAKSGKIELTVQQRSVTGSKVKTLRGEGILPAVLYGKGMESVNIQLPLDTFKKTLKSAGESTLVYVTLDGKMYPTIIADVERNPLSNEPAHADFRKVSLTEKIKAMVPVVFTGESAAVKDLGGIFVRNINELEVQALPADMPHEITVDISGLKAFGDQIVLGDIELTGATFTADEGDIVATVQEPKSEEELAAELAAPTTDVSAVEELKKEEKPAEEGEEGEAAPAETPAPEAKKE